MTKKVKQTKRNKIAKAEMQQAVIKSAPIDDFAETAKVLAKHPKMAKVLKSKKAKADKLVAAITKAEKVKLPADLDVRKIPMLDRTPKSKKEQEAFEARTRALVEADQKRSAAGSAVLRGVTSPAPKESNLTEADKKAIAELQAQQKAKPADKHAKADKTAKPTKQAKAAPKGKTAKPKMATSEKADAVWKMLSHKNGASNSEFVAALGFRWNIGPMKALAKARGFKLDVKVVDGTKRYAKGAKIG